MDDGENIKGLGASPLIPYLIVNLDTAGLITRHAAVHIEPKYSVESVYTPSRLRK